eukprot:m.68797 g.68797  ORF g.68797 m.68797 type:complete len:427 (-) comp7517_c0_seq5:406-1686(-)
MLKKFKNWVAGKKADSKFKEYGPGHSLVATQPLPQAAAQAERAHAAAALPPPPSSTAQPAKSAASVAAAEAALARLTSKTAKPVARPASRPAGTQLSPPPSLPAESAQPAQPASRQEHMRVSAAVRLVCPICEVVIPATTGKDHLVECLQAQMEEDPITASAGLVYTMCTDPAALATCVETLMTYLRNIHSAPDEPKFRRIRQGNPNFQARVVPVLGAVEMLHAVGYEPLTEGGETFLVLSGPGADVMPRVEAAMEILGMATPIVPDLYHDPVVYELGTSQTIPHVSVPDDFYQLSAAEARQLQSSARATADELHTLRTQAMRDAQAARRQRHYAYGFIRVRLANRYLLQGTFRASHTVNDVIQFVTDCLAQPAPAFQLQPMTGALPAPDSTLADGGLLPATVLNLSAAGPVQLRPDLLAAAVKLA